MHITHQEAGIDTLWSRNFIKIMLVNFLEYIPMYILLSVLPLHASKHFGSSGLVAGLTTGVFLVSSVLSRPFFGNLLDHTDKRKVLVAGTVLFTLPILTYSLTAKIEILLIFRFIQGIGWGAVNTSAMTIASFAIPAARRGEGLGYFGIASTIAMAIGPAFGLYFFNRFSFVFLFVILFIIGILGCAASLQMPDEERMSFKEKNSKQKLVIIEKSAVLTSAVLFLVAITYGGVITFLPAYAIYRGINDIGAFFTIYAIALLITRPIMGKLSDRHGVSKVLIPGMGFLIAALIILYFAASFPVFLISGALYGLGFGSVKPILDAITITLSPAERRGAANATFISAMDFGVGAGSSVWGILSQSLGFAAVYLLSAFLTVISLIIYLATIYNKKMIESNGDDILM